MAFLNQYGFDEIVYIHRNPPEVCGCGRVVTCDAWNNNGNIDVAVRTGEIHVLHGTHGMTLGLSIELAAYTMMVDCHNLTRFNISDISADVILKILLLFHEKPRT